MRSACPLIVPQSHLTLFPFRSPLPFPFRSPLPAFPGWKVTTRLGCLRRASENTLLLPVPTLLQPLSPLHSYSHSFCHGCEHPPGCLRLCTQTCLEFVPAARVPTQTWMRPRVLDQAVPDSLALAGRGDSTPRWGEILVAQNSPSCV